MSVVRLLSTVLAIFVTFLWAGYVVNACKKTLWPANWLKRTLIRKNLLIRV